MPPRFRNVVFVLLVLSLAFRLAFLTRGIHELVTHGPLYDDSFYCFSIARNIAEGFGSSFDQVHPTNGYQPLYVAFLVPLYWLTAGHPVAPIYLALVFSAILNVLTGWLLFRLLRRFVSPLAAIFGLVLWGFGPAIVRQSVNGLETSMAMFFIAAVLDYYVNVFRPHPRPSSQQAATLGLLLGLAILARIDALIFAVALGADALWMRRTQARFRPVLITALVGVLVLVPWFVVSHALVGEVIPVSGKATRFLSEEYAPHDIPEVAGLSFEEGPPAELLLHNLRRSVLLLGTAPPLHVFMRFVERVLLAVRVERQATLYALFSFLLFMCMVFVYVAWRQRRRAGRALPGDFNFLYLYSVLLVVSYSFVVFGQIFYSRYYYPIFFFSIVLGALAFEMFMGLLGSRQQLRRKLAGLAIIALYALVLPYMSWNRLQNGDYRFLNVVQWITTSTEETARIGVFNCGAIGYFSDRFVVNLDGKVNPDALAALEAREMRRYVAREGLDYVIDHGWIVQHFLLESEDEAGIAFVEVAGADQLGVPGWRAYRVEQLAAGVAAPQVVLPTDTP